MKTIPKQLLFIVFLAISPVTYSQAWDFVFDSISTLGRQVILTSDSNYLATGMDNSYEDDNLSLKLNQDGDTIWTSPNGGYSVTQTYDHKFVLAGSNYPNAVLKKIDGNGALEWYKTYGSGSQEEYHKVIQSSDSGLVACGFTQNHGDSSFLVRKTDSQGNTLWTTCFYSRDHNSFRDVIEFNYHYYLVGHEYAETYPPYYLFIAKVTMSGVPRWHKLYEMGLTGYAIAATHDSELVVAGGNLLTRLNTDGDTLWTKKLMYYWDARSIDITPENGYIISGTNESFYDVNFLAELDEYGERIWAKSYPTVSHPYWGCFGSVKCTPDGGFITCGFSLYTNQNITRLRVMKTDATGNIIVGTGHDNDENELKIIRPNPSDGRFTVELAGIKKVEVFDIGGRLANCSYGSGQIDISHCDDGIYLIRITTVDGVTVLKAIKH